MLSKNDKNNDVKQKGRSKNCKENVSE